MVLSIPEDGEKAPSQEREVGALFEGGGALETAKCGPANLPLRSRVDHVPCFWGFILDTWTHGVTR